MKKTFITALAFLAVFLARADYPIMSQHYAADPAGLEWNGRLYVFCSNDDDNDQTNYLMHSILCFSTDDLKNWTDHGVVFDAKTNTSWAGYAWAPSVVSNYNRLYLYFGNGTGGIGVATNSTPTGPFNDACGKVLINSATPGAATTNQWYFDPCAFIDDNGQPFLYFGGYSPTNARVILLGTNMISVTGTALPMNATNFFEASCLHKRNGIYYYTYSSQPPSAILCETNSNPTNGFVYQGTVLANTPYNYYNNNQSSFFSYQGVWYCAYHNRYVATQNGVPTGVERNLCLDLANFNANGSMQAVTCTADGLTQLKHLNPYARVEAETFAQQSGIKTESCQEGGLDVTSITKGSWLRIRGVDFGTGASNFTARVASTLADGSIELRLDSLAGTLSGTCRVPLTGGPQNWVTAACAVNGAAGVHDLYLNFQGGTGTNLFNVNWWQFQTNLTLTTPIHRYRFNETGGTNVADSVGGSAWTGTLPVGGTLANGQLALASSSNQYARLPSGIVSTLTNFTLSAWVNLNSTAGWNRIFDFGNNTTTYLFLTPQNGSSTVRFAITTNSAGGEQPINGTSALTLNAWHYVAVTLSGSTGILYVDGVPVGTNSALTLKPVSLGATTNNYLGKSQWSDPYFDGRLAEFCIYNVALSPDEIAMTCTLESGQSQTATINPAKTYQTVEGLGAATAFYQGWLTAHPYKQEIYTNAFAGLNLSMLRLGDWYRYPTTLAGFDSDATEIVSNANRLLGHSLPVFMSSWAPPAFLKSNGQVGNGGTLVYSNGGFAYTNFAQYWYDSIRAYQSNGVNLTWISIQNEPDWAAGYDSCVFHPTEDTVNGTNYASYSKALDACFQLLTNLPSPPKLLAPEVLGIGYSDVQNYAATMSSNSFYGVAHHLYHGSTDGTPDGYSASLLALTNVFPAKPRFMTEFGVTNMIDQACLIHNVLVLEQASGYNYWSLVWPGTSGGLIQIEFPWNQSSWTNAPVGTATQSHGWWLAPSYWALKHFSSFINPGYRRVDAADNDRNVRTSAFLSPDGLRLVAVLINTNPAASSPLNFDTGAFPVRRSAVYQTVGTNTFVALGALTNAQVLPPLSLTTVVFDKLTGSPSVAMTVTGTSLTFVWPAVYAGFALQSSTNLVAANWTTMASPSPQVVGTNYQVTLPATNQVRFFRLAQ